MMTDPIADMLTRIRNAANARHDKAIVPHSRLKEQIVSIFKEEGFLSDVEIAGKGTKKTLVVTLKYNASRKPIFSELSRVSKCGRRVYISRDEISLVHYGRGVAVLSTSKGVMRDSDAKRKGLGGEVLCMIW